MLTIKDSERAISDDEITRIELQYRIALPDEYRAFLKSHNGGRPKPSGFWFQTPRGKVRSSIDWFLAIYNGEYDNWETYYHTFKVHQVRMPPELVPIAHDAGGNQICIDVSKRVGAVYFWDHEEEADVPDYSNVYLIAASFSEFLDSLHD